MSVILVIQPDAAQGRVLHDMARRIGAELVIVESTKKAVDAIARQVPDLILLSAFLSPRDEDTLIGRLRSLEGASHLQTMTIPQFRTSEESKAKRGFGFRKKQKAAVAVGADPSAFADEVVSLLNRASEIRNRPATPDSFRSVIAPDPVPAQASTLIDDEPRAAWGDGNEDEPAPEETLFVPEEPAEEPAVEVEEEPIFVNTLVAEPDDTDLQETIDDEPAVAWPAYAADARSGFSADTRSAFAADAATADLSAYTPSPSAFVPGASIFADDAVSAFAAGAPSTYAADAASTFAADAATVDKMADRTKEKSTKSVRSISEEIDQLVKQLGLDIKLAEIDSLPPEDEAATPADTEADEFDFAASLDRARNQALTRSNEFAATNHADAEAIRESALAEARAMAEHEAREAREASAAAIARVQAEAEAARKDAEARAAVERQAREALAADLARAQSDAEEKRELALAEARAAEARAAAERQAREALAADLARKHSEAEQKRELALAEARAAEAQAAAEREARKALAADLARAKTEAAQKREAALAEARAAEERVAEERRAREALAADLARAQTEAEQRREAALAEARAAEARAADERKAREALAADLARAQTEAEQRREAAIAEARAIAEREAREALAADLARVQIEAEQMRDKAIAEARAAAECEARQALEVEVARVRSEAHSTFTDELNKVKVEAEEAERRRAEAERVSAHAQEEFARELLRVRMEVEQSLSAQLDAARAEGERIREAEAEAVRERAAMEAQLKNELDRLRFVTTQARKADASETKKAAQQIKQLEAELANVRAKAEERKNHEVEELRTQMAEMREAAAQHARTAAAEAVAAAVAAATPRPPAVVTQFPTREVAKIALQEVEEETGDRGRRDYLSLWSPRPAAPPVEIDEEPEEEGLGERFLSAVSAVNVRQHAKWALPVAACLIVVTNTGTAISTMSKLFQSDEKPRLVVQPLQEETPFIEVVERRVGKLQLDSTPSGAEAILDGKSYGRTPVTIPDLEVGLHTLQLKGTAGTLTKKVTIKANQTTLLTEPIYSGWFAIFSPIPVKVVIDGAPVSLTEDGRVMVAPGNHVVEFINTQFNYRATERLEVRPGETTPHTLTLPMGTIRVTAPEGAAILVDGRPAAGIASEGLSVAIGSHEISARHPNLGERRMPVDVKHGGLTEVTMRFE